MSDKSLFSKHLKLIEQDESKWDKEDREEYARLQSLRLPPLELKPSFWQAWKTQIQIGMSVAVMASLALMVTTNLRKEELTAKGSFQVSVFWERAGKVQPLTEETVLQDGDKVGASVVNSEEGVAYWTITDDKMKALSDSSDVETSLLRLEPGLKKNFNSSFVLTAPNQGEHLVVAVCSKPQPAANKKPVDSLFDREFMTQLLDETKIRSSDCVFVGYRLRRRL